MLHGTEEDPKRFSTLCKLLYHRLSGSHRSTVELFVTDSSLQNVTPFAEMTDELLQYVKIFGKSNHVLPEELRKARTNAGAILSAKNLLLQGMLEVGRWWFFFFPQSPQCGYIAIINSKKKSLMLS